MRTTQSTFRDELTARARLRNSAIELFALRGFEASVREIATHAGVTAGLITHHFGSKQSLREECDTEVLRQYRSIKSDGLAMSPAQSIAMLAELDEFAAMLVYILRSVRDGGVVGSNFLEQMVHETVAFTAEGVSSGVVRPSRDPQARARYLVNASLGGLLLQLAFPATLNLAEVGPMIRAYVDATTLPALEIYTEGLLTDHGYLDEYLLYVGDPPRAAGPSNPNTPTTSENSP